MQAEAISPLPEFIRRQPRAHTSGFLLSMHQPGAAVCFPKVALCQRSFLLTKMIVDRFSWALQFRKGGKGCLVSKPGALSSHSLVGPTVLWLWRSKSTVKDIFSYRELSTAELKHKACPLWWLVSGDLTDSNTCTRNTGIMTALLVGSRTSDSAGFPQPLTHSSSSHYLQIWLSAVMKQGKGTTWLRSCN